MRVSFIHSGGEGWASYRYRCRRPAEAIGASVNDPSADVLVFLKPVQGDVEKALEGKARGARIVFDVCDDHFGHIQYREMAKVAELVTCPTRSMAAHLRQLGLTQPIAVVPDPYEFEEKQPQPMPAIERPRLLWFGHALNLGSLVHWMPALSEYPLEIVSNLRPPGLNGYTFTKWSLENLRAAFWRSDIVLMPVTEPWKSPNRTVEALRQGKPVVASPSPSVHDIPGVYLGNMVLGVKVLAGEGLLTVDRVLAGQNWIRDRYSIEACAAAWRAALQV
jgi:glycosyltransferase involved in cell wall biosynthesis